MKIKKLDFQIRFILTVLLVATIVVPVVIYNSPMTDFGTKGEIGDFVGGITAPFFILLAAVLLYYTIMEQINTSKKYDHDKVYARQYEAFVDEINWIKEEIDKFHHPDCFEKNGDIALNYFSECFAKANSAKEYVDIYESSSYSKFISVLTSIEQILETVMISEMTKTDKRILSAKVYRFYRGSLSQPCGNIYSEMVYCTIPLDVDPGTKRIIDRFQNEFLITHQNIADFILAHSSVDKNKK